MRPEQQIEPQHQRQREGNGTDTDLPLQPQVDGYIGYGDNHDAGQHRQGDANPRQLSGEAEYRFEERIKTLFDIAVIVLFTRKTVSTSECWNSCRQGGR